MMVVEETLKQTPLIERHKALKAKLVPFGGWEMPLQYAGIMQEYNHTRRAVAVFDTSHMGEFVIEGDAQETGLDKIVTQNIQNMPIKSCRYGMMLNAIGGIIDDLIVFRLGLDSWFIVVNGVTTLTDAEHFKGHLTPQAKFTDISRYIGKLDIQGPLSREVVALLNPGIAKLGYYMFDEFNVLGEEAIVSRTGYTGELGYEIYYPWDKLAKLWDFLLKNEKVKPAGLGARDVLRLEMGYSLYGQDIDETTSPLEAGLGVFTDFSKNFIGKESLLDVKTLGLKQKLICFVSENRRSPRHNYKIFLKDAEEEIGIVTSGTFSPSLNKGIGMGYVRPEFSELGANLMVGDKEDKFSVVIVSRPFYKSGSLKN